jgi:hypothetical protein
MPEIRGCVSSRNCIIGPRIVKNCNFLKQLCNATSNSRRLSLLKRAKPDQILSVVEICVNILESIFTLTDAEKQLLHPHAKLIRRLSISKSPITARIVAQKGDGFAFAPLILPVLLEVARHLLSSR